MTKPIFVSFHSLKSVHACVLRGTYRPIHQLFSHFYVFRHQAAHMSNTTTMAQTCASRCNWSVNIRSRTLCIFHAFETLQTKVALYLRYLHIDLISRADLYKCEVFVHIVLCLYLCWSDKGQMCETRKAIIHYNAARKWSTGVYRWLRIVRSLQRRLGLAICNSHANETCTFTIQDRIVMEECYIAIHLFTYLCIFTTHMSILAFC